MKMGPITAVQVGSPAPAAGLKAGDIIEAVDGQSLTSADPGSKSWTPDTLPELMRQAAVAGKTVTLTIQRDRSSEHNALASGENALADREQLQITVHPRVPDLFHSVFPPLENSPMVVPALGITYRIENDVVAVVPGGPAASTGILAGDSIVCRKIQPAERTLPT